MIVGSDDERTTVTGRVSSASIFRVWQGRRSRLIVVRRKDDGAGAEQGLGLSHLAATGIASLLQDEGHSFRSGIDIPCYLDNLSVLRAGRRQLVLDVALRLSHSPMLLLLDESCIAPQLLTLDIRTSAQSWVPEAVFSRGAENILHEIVPQAATQICRHRRSVTASTYGAGMNRRRLLVLVPA